MSFSLHSFFKDARGRELVCVALLCLAIQLAYLLFDFNCYTFNDTGSYMWMSYSWDNLDFVHPPGYSYFLRIIFTLVGLHHRVVVLTQVLLGCLVAVMLFAISRHTFHVSRGIALVPSMLSSLSPMNQILERYIMAESVTLALFTLFLLVLMDYFARPRWFMLVVIGLLAAVLPIFRLCWSFVGPLTFCLFILFHWIRRDLPMRRWLVWGLLLACSFWIPQKGYDAWRSARMAVQRNEPAQGANLNDGWALWCRVCVLARPGDLDQYPWGPILLSDMESLKLGDDFQGWSRRSTAYKLQVTYCDNSRWRANRLLKQAALHLIGKYPGEFLLLILKNMPPFFLPVSVEDLATEKVYPDGPEAGTVFMRTSPLAKPYFGWLWTKPIFMLAIIGGWVLAVRRPRERFALFALTSLGGCYFLLHCVVVGYRDRYFQPLELIGALALGAIVAIRQTGRAVKEPEKTTDTSP